MDRFNAPQLSCMQWSSACVFSHPSSPKDPRWVSSGRGDGHDPSLVSRKRWSLRRWLASDWASLSEWGLSHPVFPLHWVFVFSWSRLWVVCDPLSIASKCRKWDRRARIPKYFSPKPADKPSLRQRVKNSCTAGGPP